MEEMNTPTRFQMPEEEEIDIRKLVMILVRNWFWFAGTVILALCAAWLYNRYSKPVFETSARVLIEKDNAGSPLSSLSGGSGEVFGGFGFGAGNQYVPNQVAILSSRPLVEKTLSDLGFEVTYTTIGRIKTEEGYTDVPFSLMWEKSHPQIIGTEFHVDISSTGEFHISAKAEMAGVYNYDLGESLPAIPNFKLNKKVKAGEKVSGEGYAFTLLLSDKFKPNNIVSYAFTFNPPGEITETYRKALTATLEEKQASVIRLTLADMHPKKAADFLNRLSETYFEDNLEKKNRVADRTIDFIGEQLRSIADSLTISESRKQSFQSANQVLSIPLQTQQLLEQTSELDKERVKLVTQNKYYTYLSNYMKNNQEPDNIIAPSSMGVDDPLLANLILQLNQLSVEKSSSMTTIRNPEHPTLKRINAQMENIKNALIENTNSMLVQSKTALSDVNARIRAYDVQVRKLPTTERNYVNIERRYNVDSETYTFLMQKMSEAQIAKASNVPDGQILEDALPGQLIKPKKMMNYAIALMLGLALPALVIFLRNFFNTKVLSNDDIESVTKLPMVGHIFFNDDKEKTPTPVLDKPNSPATEPYRGLRNKLNLMTKGKEKPVIAVTSTVPGEGKSYTALNVASSFALTKKKTILLDLDLRNSRFKQVLNLETDLGVVDYIMGEATCEEIICKTKHPFLDIITAGPIPPNPGEMLTDKKLGELLAALKQKYEVIILDTAPIGYVTDLFQITDQIDATLYVVRHGKTNKNFLQNALEEVKVHKLRGVGIVVNAIKHKKGVYSAGYGKGYGYGYGYGYDYGYGYGYGYGQSDGGKNSGRKVIGKE